MPNVSILERESQTLADAFRAGIVRVGDIVEYPPDSGLEYEITGNQGAFVSFFSLQSGEFYHTPGELAYRITGLAEDRRGAINPDSVGHVRNHPQDGDAELWDIASKGSPSFQIHIRVPRTPDETLQLGIIQGTGDRHDRTLRPLTPVVPSPVERLQGQSPEEVLTAEVLAAIKTALIWSRHHVNESKGIGPDRAAQDEAQRKLRGRQ